MHPYVQVSLVRGTVLSSVGFSACGNEIAKAIASAIENANLHTALKAELYVTWKKIRFVLYLNTSWVGVSSCATGPCYCPFSLFCYSQRSSFVWVCWALCGLQCRFFFRKRSAIMIYPVFEEIILWALFL